MKKTKRALFTAPFLTLVLTFSNLLFAQAKATYKIEGLDQEVEILRDKWGVSHIYAKTVEDLFLAQGFNAARDRLWQLDVWRRQGEGKLAEAFGKLRLRRLERVRSERLNAYQQDLSAEALEAYRLADQAYLRARSEAPESPQR